MSKHFLTIALMGLSLNMSAKPLNFFAHSNIPAPIQKKLMGQLNSLTGQNSLFKTTAAKERVAAEANYSYTGSTWIVQDSTKYMYDKDRSAEFNFSDMEYSNYGYNEGVKADSSVTYTFTGSGLELGSTTKASYNSSNNMTTFADANGSPLTNSSKYDYTYNSSGNIIKEVEYAWNSPVWDSVTRTTYVYNGQGKLTQSSVYDITMGEDQYKVDYTYNGNGDMIQMVFSVNIMSVVQPVFRISNTYDANHNVVTTTAQQYGLSGWENSSLDSFAYNSGNSIYVYHDNRLWDSATSSWQNSELETRTMNAQALPQKQTFSAWDSASAAWVPYEDALWVYNGSNLPAKAEYYSYTGTTPNNNADNKSYYYYEYYFDLGVSNIDKRQLIKVYPNPAANNVFVQLDKPANATTNLSVVNSVGQVVHKQQIVTGSDMISISVDKLTAGNYFITITDLTGNAISTASFVKQ